MKNRFDSVEQLRGKPTNIQLHPSKPAVPLMNPIPYAIKPENAPARDAAPKKRPMRN
jgi:hypothetical protein